MTKTVPYDKVDVRDVVGNCEPGEVPVGRLERGRRFELVLHVTGKRIPGVVVNHETFGTRVWTPSKGERSFTTKEGTVVTLRSTGELQRWPGQCPVVPLDEVLDMDQVNNLADIPRLAGLKGQIQNEEDNVMAGQVAQLPGVPAQKEPKAAPAVAKAPHEPKAPKVVVPCNCGCGEQTTSRFRPGHDARYYSMLKKVVAGTMKFGELPRQMQTAMKNIAGCQAAIEASNHK